MSVSISVTGYTGKGNPEFKKHAEAVEFCIARKLSFPAETLEFFKDKKVAGENIEDLYPEYILEHLKKGIEVPIPQKTDPRTEQITINVRDIPKETETIIIELS